MARTYKNTPKDCKVCGIDIHHRKAHAIYCLPCSRLPIEEKKKKMMNR
jgi:hypothetical protein